MNKAVSRPASLRGKPYLSLRVISGFVMRCDPSYLFQVFTRKASLGVLSAAWSLVSRRELLYENSNRKVCKSQAKYMHKGFNMTPNTNETQIQNNTIDLLKNMGYTYLSPEEMTRHRSSTGQVVLKDILLKQLQKLKGFSYKGMEYPFSTKCTKIKEHIA